MVFCLNSKLIHLCGVFLTPKAQKIVLRRWHFLGFGCLILQIQMLSISTSVSTSCLKIRITQFCTALLLRAQCWCTSVLKSCSFCSFISYSDWFCKDLSLTSHPYMVHSVHTTLLAISHCLQECSYLKAFILPAALPGPSFSQIYLWWAQLKTLWLIQKLYLKLQSFLYTS